jgi:hypothetical protein
VCGPCHRGAPSEALRARRADAATARRVRGDLDCIVLTALREEPERRYVSAGQLGEEIGRFLDGRPVLAQQRFESLPLRHFKSLKTNGLRIHLSGCTHVLVSPHSSLFKTLELGAFPAGRFRTHPLVRPHLTASSSFCARV